MKLTRLINLLNKNAEISTAININKRGDNDVLFTDGRKLYKTIGIEVGECGDLLIYPILSSKIKEKSL